MSWSVVFISLVIALLALAIVSVMVPEKIQNEDAGNNRH